MQRFTIHRCIADPPAHLSEPLPAVCVGAEQEIPLALRKVLNFQLSESVLLLLGTVPSACDGAGQAVRQVISRMCDEVIGPLAARHSITVQTTGARAGLASVIGQTRAALDFSLLGVKKAAPRDPEGEGIDCFHSHLLTVVDVSDEALTSARLVAAHALAHELGANYYRVLAILMGGDTSMWGELGSVVRAGLPLIVVEGSGGIADEIALVRTYQRESNRPYLWSVESPPKAPFPIEDLDLRAAGFFMLYQDHRMPLRFCTGTDPSSWLYSQLKSEFNIHSKD